MKCIVYGGIQTILPCIFDKFKFQTKGLTMLQNDAKIDYYTLIYFPVLTLLNELSNPIHFDFFCYSYRILISHFFFSLNKSIFYF